jgi:hypothetical protein
MTERNLIQYSLLIWKMEMIQKTLCGRIMEQLEQRLDKQEEYQQEQND